MPFQDIHTAAFPLVAVVILNYNGAGYLEKFLPGVLQSTYPNLRVVVADNASTDASVALLRDKFPQVEVMQLAENLGYAGGYNAALAGISAEYFVLLNSDVAVTPGWIEPIIALMQQDESIGACQPKLLMYDNTQLFEYAGACGGWIDVLGYPFARGRVFDTVETDAGQYNNAEPCFWASGAALFVRRLAFEKAGGLDASFFAHQEEIDLCWRMQLRGFRVYVQPASVVYHVGGGTLPKTNAQKTFLNFRNNLAMLSKNSLAQDLVWKLPLRLVLDWVAATRFLGTNPKLAAAVLRAHAAFFRWWLQAGNNGAGQRPLNQLPGVYRGSIVVAYYLRGKKTFKEILSSR